MIFDFLVAKLKMLKDTWNRKRDRNYLDFLIDTEEFCASARSSIVPRPAGAKELAGVSSSVVPFHLSIVYERFICRVHVRVLSLRNKNSKLFLSIFPNVFCRLKGKWRGGGAFQNLIWLQTLIDCIMHTDHDGKYLPDVSS